VDEHLFPSTTWEWRKVKITRRPQGHATVRRSRSFWHHLPRRDRKQSVYLEVRWRAGAESWWLVKARGSHGAVPGWMMLEDLMSMVLNEHTTGDDPPD